MWIEEFDRKIIDKFIDNKKIRLRLTFGYPNDSYELSFTDDLFKYDAFFLYKYNQTHQYLPYFEKNYVFKRFLNYFDLCSCDLMNTKFIVPCDPINYLNNEYLNWKDPEPENFKWLNLDLSGKREWPEDPIYYFEKTTKTPVILNLTNFNLFSLLTLFLFLLIVFYFYLKFLIKQ